MRRQLEYGQARVRQQAVYAREVEKIGWIILGRGGEALSVVHLTRNGYET